MARSDGDSLAFGQLTDRESLRDIEVCRRAMGAKQYHTGFHRRVARSTLADANDSRDWRIDADFAQFLIRIARPLYARDPIGVDLAPDAMYAQIASQRPGEQRPEPVKSHC